ncbi:MarR family transcriptional regulator [Halarchaeum sp. CBA1220]|uniref:helix-turn-helix transcriptional regulator n=1 Tax=Halarchaeum sp. CBA1220 TaxID=1853682 RepID=UPI000F3A9F03|nr:MarR family transcriptional regulator [Halarchaeum sp. CBA1220]QLC34475.1 MarR family transcriptional regulator [Halarchaeum sp. CBA1220]
MSAESGDLSEDEERALELVREQGSIYQSEFWKELDVSSRKGSRIAKKLAEKGLVEREDAVHNGNTTYLIKPVIKEEDLDFSLLMAGDMLSPFVGEEEVDARSDAFSQWIMNLVYEDPVVPESEPEPEPEQ